MNYELRVRFYTSVVNLYNCHVFFCFYIPNCKNAFWDVYTGLPRFSCENLAMSRTVCVLVAMLNGLKSFALGYGTPPKASTAGGTCDAEEDGAKRKGGTADGSLLPERPEYC